MTDDERQMVADQTAELVQHNSERLRQLQMHNITINIDALTQRHLIETLFPDEDDRAVLNLGFQQRLAESLHAAEEQVDRITLERSAQQASGLIVPRPGQS